MLRVVVKSFILSVVMLGVVMLIVVMLSVVILSVVASFQLHFLSLKCATILIKLDNNLKASAIKPFQAKIKTNMQ